MPQISNLSEAVELVKRELLARKANLTKSETVIADYANGFPIKHGRLWVEQGGQKELYQIKFAKSGYRLKPTDRLSAGAKELDIKLRFALKSFGKGEETLNGLNEDVILELVKFTESGTLAFFVTVMGDGAIYVSPILDFYSFVMRYDTFFKFPRSHVPVCEVPTGWMARWAQLKSSPPEINKD